MHGADGPLRDRSHQRQELFQRAHWIGEEGLLVQAMLLLRESIYAVNVHTGLHVQNPEFPNGHAYFAVVRIVPERRCTSECRLV